MEQGPESERGGDTSLFCIPCTKKRGNNKNVVDSNKYNDKLFIETTSKKYSKTIDGRKMDMQLLLEGVVWSTTTRKGRKKDGTEFETGIVSILQDGEPNPAVVKMSVDEMPEKGEKVILSVYPSGWVTQNGKAAVDLHLSRR